MVMHAVTVAPTSAVLSTTGTYVGNDAADRAITHGLGATPKMVIYFRDDTGDVYLQLQGIAAQKAITASTAAVTVMDATDFHVGAAGTFAGNITGANYTWVAIA